MNVKAAIDWREVHKVLGTHLGVNLVIRVDQLEHVQIKLQRTVFLSL